MTKQLIKLFKLTLKLAVLVGISVGGWYAYQYYVPVEEDDGLGQLPTVLAEYRDITVSVQAIGVLQPIRIIEIKSRASGEILEMPVEMGDYVEAGDIIVQVDTNILDQELKQADADLLNNQVRRNIARTQFERAQSLFDQGLISENELENNQQNFANAEAQLLRSEAASDLAKDRLADATVRAPLAGTIIAKTVEEGQIIASSANDVSGGTTLIQMADLSELQIRTLVEEVDIGQIKRGLEVESNVEAFPDRQFLGEVIKIEPQAVVQQSVTSFPVLSRIDNPAGKLLPGMNADVNIVVHRKPRVLVIPNEGVRTPADANRVSMMLGLIGATEGEFGDFDRAGDFRSRGASAGGAGGDRGRSAPAGVAGGDRGRGASAGGAGGDRRGGAGGSSFRGDRGRGGAGGSQGRGAGRGQGGGEDMRARLENASPAERQRLIAEMRAAFEARSENPDPFGLQGRREDAAVFVWTAEGALTTKAIVVGARDWEFTEILEGLTEGDEVVLLPSTSLLESQDRMRNWARGRSGIPGMGGGRPPGVGRGRR